MSDANVLLELKAINKAFGDLQANRDVDLSIERGKIHALLGENGAGKSTLVKIICGVQQADSGQILWRGEPATIPNPVAARELGIGVVFQHFSLFRALTVEQNIALGLPKMQRANLAELIHQTSHRYGFDLDPDRPLHTLSVGEWQRVEIVRCLLSEPALIVLDEPTSVLTPQEAELLFQTLRKLAGEGCAVIYISHRLVELKQLCHSATVMRNGEVVALCDPQVETPENLAQMMIGHKPTPAVRSGAGEAARSECLSVSGLSRTSPDPFGVDLTDIGLDLAAGEILAVAGIAGNGQQELGEALSGERLSAPGTIRFQGRDIGALPPGARRKLGIHYVPEERHGHGAVSGMALWENAALTARDSQRLVKSGLLDGKATREFCGRVIDDFDVRCTGSQATASSLSGGNLQKFIIGREIVQRPQLMIVMQPTWGVDAGAAAHIHQALLDLAAAGTAVLVISQDLDEILALGDKIAVIADGRLSEARPAAEMTAERIGMLMGAVHGERYALEA